MGQWRIFLIVGALLLAGSAAWADVDVDVDLGFGLYYSDGYYSNSAEWWAGDGTLWRGSGWWPGNGLSVITGGDGWSARFSTGQSGYPDGYYPVSAGQQVQPYDSLVQPFDSLVEPYEPLVGTDYNDRWGYRVPMPRGRGGAPELYGDYSWLEGGGGDSGNYAPGGVVVGYPWYYSRGYPQVYHYTYGNYPWWPYNPTVYYLQQPPAHYYQQPVAGSYPGGWEEPRGEGYVSGEAVNIYEGDVYNYYYGGEAAPAAAAPAAQPEAVATPAEPYVDAFGQQFNDRTRLDTPDGVWVLMLEDGGLKAHTPSGARTEIAGSVDYSYGAYAAWLPDSGPLVMFKAGGTLAAAYPADDGQWWVEYLAAEVDFSHNTTVELIGGAPWAVFTGIDGERYVYTFQHGLWQEVGSGSASR